MLQKSMLKVISVGIVSCLPNLNLVVVKVSVCKLWLQNNSITGKNLDNISNRSVITWEVVNKISENI